MLADQIHAGKYGNIHSLLIARNGQLASENYFEGADQDWGDDIGRVKFTADTLHDLRSITKTVVSTLVGIAIAQGRIPSASTPVYRLLPQYANLLKGEKRKLTVKDLLTMSAGLEWNETTIPYTDQRNGEEVMDRSADPVGYVLSRPIATRHGLVWNYSGGLTQTLAAIVEKSTGTPIRDYAQKFLFEPMGIKDVDWRGDLAWRGDFAGMANAASGLRLKPRDLLKLGLMFQAGGRWNGRQIVPESWLKAAMAPQIDLPKTYLVNRPDWVLRGAYGYQWWYVDMDTAAGPLAVHSAVGNGQQRIFVVSKLNLVVVISAGEYNNEAAYWSVEKILRQVIAAIKPDALER